MGIAWLKIVHVAALTIWCAGLLVLPTLYARSLSSEGGSSLDRLESFARYVYTHAMSPAAFVAIGSGTALIFFREAYAGWMALKLAAVGALVLLHMRAGFVIVRIFDPIHSYAAWRRWTTIVATLAIILTILWLVLAKPLVDFSRLPDWLREPGALHSLFEMTMPTP